MKKIDTIFRYGDGELGVDEDYNLYWNKKKVTTKQKVTLQRSVNIAIIFASISTVLLAIFAALELLGCGAK